MKNWLFATTFSINRSQRKLVTYYLTFYDKQAQAQYMVAQDQGNSMQGLQGL